MQKGRVSSLLLQSGFSRGRFVDVVLSAGCSQKAAMAVLFPLPLLPERELCDLVQVTSFPVPGLPRCSGCVNSTHLSTMAEPCEAWCVCVSSGHAQLDLHPPVSCSGLQGPRSVIQSWARGKIQPVGQDCPLQVTIAWLCLVLGHSYCPFTFLGHSRIIWGRRGCRKGGQAPSLVSLPWVKLSRGRWMPQRPAEHVLAACFAPTSRAEVSLVLCCSEELLGYLFTVGAYHSRARQLGAACPGKI